MVFYLDTSAFIKLLVDEEHADTLRAFVHSSDDLFVSSDLLRIEGLRAARSHSQEVLRQARIALDGVTLLSISATICEFAADLDPLILRSLDALHLASALSLGDELQAVITYDDRLSQACALHGVAAIAP